MERVCNKCGIEKSLVDDFYVSKKSAGGRSRVCKDCSKAASKAWHFANRERALGTKVIWRQANPDKVKRYSAEWYAANTEKAKESNAGWYRINAEIARQRRAKRREANLEEERAASREWRRVNLERARENDRQWHRDHPEESRAASARRRAALLTHDGEHYTASDVKALLEQQQGHCLYCYNRLDTYHVDHVIPLSRGGGNGKDNIALACPTCNTSKGAKLLGLEWIPPYRADAKISLAFSGQVG